METMEKRLKTCCFTGHRPAKLEAGEKEVRRWLQRQVEAAVSDGYLYFITGCAMGVDIWAGEAVLRAREGNPALRLIAANPWPEMADRWPPEWRKRHSDLLRQADEVVTIREAYHPGVYMQRNTWMVDRSSRLIACSTGAPGGTRNTILYAEKRGLEIIRFETDSEA